MREGFYVDKAASISVYVPTRPSTTTFFFMVFHTNIDIFHIHVGFKVKSAHRQVNVLVNLLTLLDLLSVITLIPIFRVNFHLYFFPYFFIFLCSNAFYFST